MKKAGLFLLIGVACLGTMAAQVTHQVQEVVTLSDERTFYLNGGVRSVAGGYAKAVIPVDLPDNTVSWLYSFSTAAGTSGIKNLNLALQVGSLLLDPSVTMARIISAVKVPTGSSAIHVYLLDEKNKKAFEDSWEVYGSNYTFVEEGSTQTTKQGVVKITEKNRGRWYLGIYNPSALEAVNVTIEVSAIVQSEVYVDEWRADNLTLIQDACKRGFQSGLSGADAVCACFVQKMAAQVTPSQWAQLGTGQVALKNALIDDCYQATGNTTLKAAEDIAQRGQKEIDALISAASASALMQDFPTAGRQLQDAVARIEAGALQGFYGTAQMTRIYNTAAWYALLNNQIDPANTLLRKGMTHSDQDMYLWKTTALYHLLKGDEEKARAAFARYKTKDRLPDGKKWNDAVAEDLLTLERNGISHQLFAAAREWLKIK